MLACSVMAPTPMMAAKAAEPVAASEIVVREGEETNPNLSLSAAISANGREADSVSAEKAKDGSTSTHWGSATNKNPHWLQLAWGAEQTIKEVVIHWERRNATSYKLQKSDDGSSWSDVMTFSEIPAAFRQRIILNDPITTKYLRVYIEAFNDTAEKENGNSVTWTSVGIIEFETYAEEQPISNQDILNTISIPSRLEGSAVENGKMKMPIVPEGYTLEMIGADYEQILDKDGTIYQPLVDKTVKMNFRLTKDGVDGYTDSQEFTTVVPGKYTVEETDNAQPAVVPALQEWKGASGDFEITDSSRIVIDPAAQEELSYMAGEFQKDYEEITGRSIEVVYEDTAAAGDFFFTLQSAEEENLGLKDEGYFMNITDKVEVKAEQKAGAYWSTRTILQILKQTGTTIPKGETRDYPRFAVRGFMLDIGRRPFSKEIVNDVINTMAWYKMNDFQLHLNDNYIFLEDYPDNNKEAKLSAYEGFRLESSIKEGGADGLYKADLTSDDMYYTKDEMRDLIQNNRKLGINVVPEIDTPAHSLSLTKVREDLRIGDVYRQSDHLNLHTRYDDSLNFVKTIWNEYFEGEDPVFDEDTIVNIGTDEYDAAYKEQFRKFTDDLLGYAQENAKRVRLWGSLTARPGTTEVRSENVEMMMWNRTWAQPAEMYEDGFKMVDINDGQLYIVPAAGYYYDYLNRGFVYNYDPAKNMGLPSGSDQVLGGSYAIWNDMVDKKANGLTEMEIYDRFWDAAGLISSGLWGTPAASANEAVAIRDALGDAPQTNAYDEVESEGGTIFAYEFEEGYEDNSDNEYDAENGAATTVEDGVLKLEGDVSYVSTPVDKVGTFKEGRKLSFDIKLTAEPQKGDIIFEADAEYNTHDIRIMDDGKLGFTREAYDYVFDYVVPVGEKVTLTIESGKGGTLLYVPGSNSGIPAVGSYTFEGDLKASNITRSVMSLPTQRIGSKTNAVKAEIDNVVVYDLVEMELDASALPNTGYQVTCDNEQPGELIGKAFDNDPQTFWHSTYGDNKKDLPATIEVNLGSTQELGGLYYLTRPSGTNGNITKFSIFYDENGSWKPVKEDVVWGAGSGEKTFYFDESVTTSKIKIVVKEGASDFGSAAEFKFLASGYVQAAATARTGGIASVSSASVAKGSEVTFSAVADEGYTFAGWYNVMNQLVSSESEYTVAISEETVLTAKFVEGEVEKEDVATPAFTVAEGTYTEPQKVKITCATEGAKVYYTVDGTEPTEDSQEYVADTEITVAETATIKAIAVKEGMDNSQVASVTITIEAPSETKVAAPVFSLAGGTLDKTQEITIDCATEGATIYYTVNGSTPSAEKVAKKAQSLQYTPGSKLKVANSMVIKAIAVKDGLESSEVITVKYDMAKKWIFSDVKSTDGWRYTALNYTYSTGVMAENGNGSGKFDGELKLTRGMFSTVLYRMAGEPATTVGSKFPDVNKDKYYAKAITWAYESGIVNGRPDGSFDPEGEITRAEIAKMLKGYADYCSFDTTAVKDLTTFADGAAVIKSSWKKEALQWATAVNMISGVTKDGKTILAADDDATRSQCAAMIERFAKEYIK